MKVTRSIQSKCKSVCYLCYKQKWIDKMMNHLAHSLDMVPFLCESLVNFINKLSHSPYISALCIGIIYLHVCFSYTSHNFHIFFSNGILIVFTHRHDTLALLWNVFILMLSHICLCTWNLHSLVCIAYLFAHLHDTLTS